MVNELHVGNAAVFVHTDADGDQELILRRSSKTSMLLVDNNRLLRSYVILTVLIRLTHTSKFLWRD